MVLVPYEGGYILVSPDYVKGTKENVAKALSQGYILPTPEMVDAIWRHADCKLNPIPMNPAEDNTDEHNRRISEQIAGRECQLIAGHKKDIVKPRRVGRVTIYGWHYPNGKPIQPVSSIHVDTYYDYSHGLRLVRIPDDH